MSDEPTLVVVEPESYWKTWLLVHRGDENDKNPYWLTSPSQQGHFWPRRQRMEASCPKGDHTAPVLDCSCGIYAVKNPKGCVQYISHERTDRHGNAVIMAVLGTVKLWGRVTQGSTGHRGQYAYPDTIILPQMLEPIAGWIVDGYGCSVEMDPEYDPLYHLSSGGATKNGIDPAMQKHIFPYAGDIDLSAATFLPYD